MIEEEKDLQLGPPQEANTGKHINFLEAEENNDGTSDNDTSSADDNDTSNADESPAKKAWEEMLKDLKSRQSKNKDQ